MSKPVSLLDKPDEIKMLTAETVNHLFYYWFWNADPEEVRKFMRGLEFAIGSFFGGTEDAKK